ncbi:MAG TPA: sigma-70 family RNA polymerase sigma factor [Ktedonobacteraceae bacterium]|nr:sigma-70 family RNA polymerase sigma factor [Ktedonobacteraceae bacterium]
MQQQDKHNLACAPDSTLYNRHAAIILAYVRSHTASWQDAEDLTLEVFLTALEHDNLSRLTNKQQLVWLWRVAHNKLIDSYRRPSQPPTVPLEQVVENACRDEALTPEQLVLRREEFEWLYKAVGKLSLLQQQILQLRFGEGLRFAEIAVLLNKREATVRKICSRSLALLRKIYDQQLKGTRS